MFFIFLVIIGIAVFGGNFVHFSVFGVKVTYLALIDIILMYIWYFVKKRGKLNLDRYSLSVMYFVLYGLMVVFISLLGLNRLYISSDLLVNAKYIPRQSIYLMAFPLIFLMKEKTYMKKIKMFVDNYGELLFWGIYISHCLIFKRIDLEVPTTIVLASISLYNNGIKRNITSYLKLCVVLFTPIAVGGEMTNVLIRLIYLYIFVFKNNKSFVVKSMTIGFVIMVAAMLILPFFVPLFEDLFDANSFWRLRYWSDEIEQLLKSKLIGVGYGTSYGTFDFVGNVDKITSGPFAAAGGYSVIDKMFVVGPHNSFISILFRLGIIGCLLFIRALMRICSGMIKHVNMLSYVSIFLFFSSVILIGVNVGLESPYYMLIFVFSIGIVIYDILQKKDAKVD